MPDLHPFAKIAFNGVVYLGVGIGEDLVELSQQLNVKRWFLVEGDAKKQKQLARAVAALADNEKFSLEKAVVSPEGGLHTWYGYNLNEFSGLKKAKELGDLFPGLKLQNEQAVETIALSDLLTQFNLTSADSNLLLIDLPGQALELLESLLKAGQKPLFSQVMVTATSTEAFESGGTVERLHDWLKKQGYHTRNEPYEDPDFPVLYYSFDKSNAANQLQLKRQVKTLTRERDDAVARASGTSKELEKIIAERDQQKKWHANHKQRADDLEKEVNTLKAENQSLKQTLETLNQTFADSQTQLLQKLDRLMASQERQTKRLETSLGMHQFWQTGEYPELGQADRLGPQLKQFLVQKLTQEHYDVIIQFGVSDSTLFIASVLDKLKSSGRQLTSIQNDKTLDFKNRNEIVRKDADDYEEGVVDASLPAEICVFEHNQSKLKQLDNSAKQRQFSHLLSTQHAPLVDYRHHGQDYLHYDSEEAIKQLKELLDGRTAKLLVLVSGPVTGSDDHNRFPAVPKILNAFNKHELHFVTDNYHEQSAKEVAINWSRLFEERGLSLEKHIIADEKPGFAWLVNR